VPFVIAFRCITFRIDGKSLQTSTQIRCVMINLETATIDEI